MSWKDAGLAAGTVSTVLFMASYVPMLLKAARTKDLRSYSAGSLLVANCGNAVNVLYVLTLPVGPIWVLHGFYLVASALMLFWWWRHSRPAVSRAGGGR